MKYIASGNPRTKPSKRGLVGVLPPKKADIETTRVFNGAL